MKRLTLRRYLSVFLPAVSLILCFALYLTKESASLNDVNEIESDFQDDFQVRESVKVTRHDYLNEDEESIAQEHSRLIVNITSLLKWKKKEVTIPLQICNLSSTAPSHVAVQMRDVFEELPFDNPDGGVWKQGYDINYDPSQWKVKKLRVFVVPHSHNDPGWLKTFEQYYEDQTRHILNLMVKKLEAYPNMRFIYAEMSFFSLWWSKIDDAMRLRVKRLLERKQLELVTGGWVMTDEANAHYFSMIDQIIEGNQWMMNQLGVKPVSGWAIDPFGHSPTMAYLLRQFGFKNMLIQRVHYSVKKYLAQNTQLEFNWRQTWDHSGTTDIFCHMMPFYSYDVPHTCGPNPKICCQFDFRRLPGEDMGCPWHVPPSVITVANVEERAETLLDQYRQKAQLYRNNVVLAPLGDDFRYDGEQEWDQQYRNYQLLFDYINSNNDLNAEVKFGTLTDYFDALRERAGGNVDGPPSGYPALSGDFFSYADRDDHYWTGYFTSRPFYKGLDRILESHQRAGEILFSLALAEARRLHIEAFPKDALMSHIVLARRNLGLFQHHDAITGTARQFVVVDYGKRLLQGLNNMKQVIINSTQFLLYANKTRYKPSVVFDVDEIRYSHDSLPVKTVVHLTSRPRAVVLYNSLAHYRSCLVTLVVNEAHLEVRDENGVVIATQISPQWQLNTDVSLQTYRVSFIAMIPALGLVKYSVAKTSPGKNPLNVFPTVTIYNMPGSSETKVGPFSIKELDAKSESVPAQIHVKSRELELRLSRNTGMLQEILRKDSEILLKVNVSFVRYGTTRGMDKSGAYLFIPDGEAQRLYGDDFPVIRITEGPLETEVQVTLPMVDHMIKIVNSPGVESSAVEILNFVDIRQESNAEIAMRFITNVKSNGEFFTDLNGFQVIRRKTYGKLPLGANFYPMAAMAFLEDKDCRFNLLTGQSLGVASLEPGWIEVMQDRRLDQDDGRGLLEPVQDNTVTPNIFQILIEPSSSPSIDQPAGYASLQSNLVSLHLLHPVHVLPLAASTDSRITAAFLPAFEPLRSGLPCDIHLLNLRTLLEPEDGSKFSPSDVTGLILHRFGVDCRFATKGVSCHFNDGQISISSLFRTLQVSEANVTSLSLLDRLSSVNHTSVLEIPPMEIRALSVRLQ